MNNFRFLRILICLVVIGLGLGTQLPSSMASSLSGINIARTAVVTTDSGDGALAIDGENFSTVWSSVNTTDDHWLALDFGTPQPIQKVVLVRASTFSTFEIQTWNGTQWINAVTSRQSGSNNVVVVNLTPVVTTSRIRLYVSSGAQVRLREIQVFRYDPQPIYVNQSGYETSRSKRFTAPLAADGTAFSVTLASNTAPLFTGTIASGIGDFSSFNPISSDSYVVRIGDSYSVPFGIGHHWVQRVSLQPAINFMVDVRCRNGNASGISPSDRKCSSGVAWRDSHQFSFELNTLIAMYAANPSIYSTARMPVQATYSGMRYSLPANTPEIVRLIYWAVEVYLKGDVNHTLLKEQLAYFVYAYPGLLDAYIPVEVYIEARDYVFANWGDPNRDRWNWYDITHTADLFQTYTVIGTGKGSFPPGHSIIPNLMMYEVALREGRGDAASYFTAAYNNAVWIINNLIPSNVEVTKGQRMSEHLLIPSLVYFYKEYPASAPSGIAAYVDQWANVMIERSNNAWDFRRYSAAEWTIPSYNEPGNVAGFPASAISAASVVNNPATGARLRQIAVAHVDNVYGRNPFGRHFSANAERDFEGVELGWFSEYSGGLGELNNSRGVLDGAPQTPQYPYNPSSAPGYTEGWVAFNTAWNLSLAYMAWEDTYLWAYDPATLNVANSVLPGQTLGIQLQAPLNFNYSSVENAEVVIRSTGGDVVRLTVNEASANDLFFRNTVQVQNAPVNPADSVIQAGPGEFLEISYGHGHWGECLIIPVTNGGTPPSTAGMSCDYGSSAVLPPSGTLVPMPTAVPTMTPLPTYTPVEGDIIMDNSDAAGVSITGAWTASSFDTGYYGSNYIHDGNAGKGTKSVTFVPSLAANGQYAVYLRWTAGSNRASSVPVTITHNGGTTTLYVNQQQNGGQWNSLGTFNLTSGSVAVTIDTTGTTGFVVVDAVNFAPAGVMATPTPTSTPTSTPTAIPTPVAGEIIIDNADANGVNIVGAWTSSIFDPGYHASSYIHDGNSDKGTKSVTFTPSLATAGQYQVFLQWSAAANRAPSVPVSIQYSGGTAAVTVNQQQNGGQWNLLGTFDLAPGAASVTVSTLGTTGFIIADAVRFVPTGVVPTATPTPLPTSTPTPLPTATWTPTVVPTMTFTPALTEITMDNADVAGVTIVGSWRTSAFDPGYYGSDYIHDRNNNKGTKSVTFTPSLPGAGLYEIFLIWPAAPNRDANVSITIQHSGGVTTVNVNQQQNGGQWNSLGIYNLAPGSAAVTVNTTGTTGYVIVDAVRFTPR